MRQRAVIAAAVLAAVALPGAYLALGGASYTPGPLADPCATREWRAAGGTDRVAEQIVLSTLDGAACELSVSREALVLALASDASRRAFARRHGLDDDGLERVARRGLQRAVDDAERAGALAGWQAALLRSAADRVPLDALLDAVGVIG